MKYLQEKVAYGKHEWRIVKDTAGAGVFVVTGRDVYEFRNDQEAYGYVIGEYRKVADMRNMQPGQAYQITMADGTMKTVNVQQQGPQAVIVMDSQTGETMNIPHLQGGAEPTPAPTQRPKVPGSPGGPTPTPNISPENITSSVLCKSDLRTAHAMRVTAGEIGREPYYCKHDRGYLYRKDPSAPEKYCAECGMVYAASKKPRFEEVTCSQCGNAFGPGDHGYSHCKDHRKVQRDKDRERDKKAKIISDDECVNCGAKSKKIDEGGQCPKCSRRKMDGAKRERAKDVQDEDQEEKIRQDGHEADYERDYDDDDREAQRTAGGNCPKCGGDGRWMDIGCHLCGGVGMVDARTERDYIEKVRQQRGDDYVQDFLRQRGAKRSEFRAWKNKHRIIRARDIQADAPMPGQQGMPSGDVANDSQTQLSQFTKEKSPADFAEDGETQPQAGPNAKRRLTPHEIIEEAESLIRNALVKGVKIGGADLVEYMTQYYSNSPEDVMQGVTLAWQKVQYEEQTESGKPAPDSAGMGPKAPTTPDEADAMAPKNGPIQTKMI